MRRVALFLSAIFVFALQVAAQESLSPYDMLISGNKYGYEFKPLGNSINNNFVIFYEVQDDRGVNKINACAINSETYHRSVYSGLAKSIRSRRWDVVWHPVVKKFMLVYCRDNEIWAQPVKLYNMPWPDGQRRKVCDYGDKYLKIAWTKKKKFVLFITRGGQLAAQALKKNGKKFKSEKKLTSFDFGEAYPVAAATKSNSEAVAYYAHYDGSTNRLWPRLISVNHKLKKYDNYAITPVQHSDSKATFVGNYDPATKIHSIAWGFGGAAKKKSHSKYCCFKESGLMVQVPTNTPKNITPTALIYDPLMGRFAIGYNTYESSAPRGRQPGGNPSTCIYLTSYNPNGAIVTKELEVYFKNQNALETGVGFARNGDILGVMSYYSKKDPAGEIRANLLQYY